jgi:hypothetical protein
MAERTTLVMKKVCTAASRLYRPTCRADQTWPPVFNHESAISGTRTDEDLEPPTQLRSSAIPDRGHRQSDNLARSGQVITADFYTAYLHHTDNY